MKEKVTDRDPIQRTIPILVWKKWKKAEEIQSALLASWSIFD